MQCDIFNDKLGQPVGMEFDGKAVTYGYEWNRLVSQSLPNGLTVQHTYNGNGWLTKTVVPRVDVGGGLLLGTTYGHDEVGNITLKDTDAGAYGYSYDSANRLTGATIPGDGPMSYAYDLSGNMTDGPLGHLDFNANNEPTAGDTYTYEHDANGNLISKTSSSGETTVYHYNGASRLARVELPDGTIVEYAYDPFGRRIKKEVDGSVTYYAYSDEGLVGEYDADGALTKAYGWRPDTTWSTAPVYMYEAEEYYWYHNDHLGTPRALTDKLGDVVWSARYEAYGQATVNEDPDEDGNAITNNLRFPGQYFDAETGLYYNWHRYYDPTVGRYIAEDPLRLASGTINFYAYVGGNPVNRFDPKGLYGTNDCSYYEKRCKQSGGGYYCFTVQLFCDDVFPKPEDPDPTRDDDKEGWFRCTRQCLQDCDSMQYIADGGDPNSESCPTNEPDPTTDSFWDSKPWECHRICYIKCFTWNYWD